MTPALFPPGLIQASPRSIFKAWLGVLPGVLLLLLGSTQAQNVLNSNFETWRAGPSGQVPAHWNVNWPADMVEPESAPGLVNCGTRACRVDVAPSNTRYHLAKQWDASAVSGKLQAKVRVLYPVQPLAQLAAITIAAAGFSTDWAMQPDSDIKTITQSPYWQEVSVSYKVNRGDARVRLRLECADAAGVTLYLDNVDFSGSDPSFEALLGPTEQICHEVKSSKLSLMFDSSRGRIMEIRDLDATGRPSGQNYVVDGGCPLYAIDTRTTLSDPAPFHQQSTTHAPFSIMPSKQGARVGFKAIAGKGDPLGITIDITADSTRPEISFVHEVQNDFRPGLLEGITCPDLRLQAQLGESATDDVTFMPSGDGSIIRHEDLEEAATYQRGLDYPGSASMQFAAFYDPQRGLTIAAEDDSGESKKIFWRRTPSSVQLSITHTLPSQANLPVATYSTVISPCSGSWMDAAAQYRAWVRRTQIWSRAERRADPAWILKRPTTFNADLRPQGLGKELVPISYWPALLSDWRSALAQANGTGGDMISLFRSFENQGTYIGPFVSPGATPLNVLATTKDPSGNYDVLHDEATVFKAWRKVSAAGHRSMAMIGGLKWSLFRKGILPHFPWPSGSSSYWVYSYNRRISRPWTGIVALDRDQNEIIDAPTKTWDSHHLEMDPTHPVTIAARRDFAAHMADKVRGGALDLYLFDQLNGGKIKDNYSLMANHPPGAGAWKGAAIRNLFAQTLDAGRQQNPDFVLSLEDPCELALESIAMQGVRPNHVRRWPAPDIPGAGELVFAFQYVYNEVCSFTSWDTYLVSDWGFQNKLSAEAQANELQGALVEHSRMLHSGSWLSVYLKPWMLVQEYLQQQGGTVGATPTTQMLPLSSRTQPTMLRSLQNSVRTSQGPAREFLNSAAMQTTRGFQVSEEITWQEKSYGGRIEELTLPAALHSAWRLEQGPCAIMISNVSPRRTPLTVALPTHIGEQVMSKSTDITLYRNGVQDPNVRTYGDLQRDILKPGTTSLQPLEVLLIVF